MAVDRFNVDLLSDSPSGDIIAPGVAWPLGVPLPEVGDYVIDAADAQTVFRVSRRRFAVDLEKSPAEVSVVLCLGPKDDQPEKSG